MNRMFLASIGTLLTDWLLPGEKIAFISFVPFFLFFAFFLTQFRPLRIWDNLGRLVFNGKTLNYPITSVKWSPNGKLLAVGSYNLILLCDKLGVSHRPASLFPASRPLCAWKKRSGSITKFQVPSDLFSRFHGPSIALILPWAEQMGIFAWGLLSEGVNLIKKLI